MLKPGIKTVTMPARKMTALSQLGILLLLRSLQAAASDKTVNAENTTNSFDKNQPGSKVKLIG